MKNNYTNHARIFSQPMSMMNFLPLSLLLLPFIVIPGMYNPYEFPKYIVLLIAIQFFIIERVIYCIRVKTSLFRWDRYCVVVIVFLLLLFMANVLGWDPHTSLLGSMYRHQGFLLWIGLGISFLLLYALPHDEKKKLFDLFAQYATVFLLIICGFAIAQGLLFFLFHNFSVATLNGRIVTTFGNPNFLASYVVMLLPIALFGTTLFTKFSYRIRLLFQAILVISATLTLLLADSKSALLALVIITVLFLSRLMSLRGSANWRRRGNLKILLPVVLVILMALFISSTLRISPWDNRGIIWSYGIQSVIQHPLLGIGQENYELIVDPARHISVDNAHNIFLELAVAAGIPTLIVFCFILFFSFKQSSFPIRLSLSAFLITAFLHPLSISQLATFWFLLSLTSSELWVHSSE